VSYLSNKASVLIHFADGRELLVRTTRAQAKRQYLNINGTIFRQADPEPDRPITYHEYGPAKPGGYDLTAK